MSEARTLCRTPTPDKQPTSMPTWKYEAVRAAILEVVPREEPGLPVKDLSNRVAARLPS